jgi:hypothetical protein
MDLQLYKKHIADRVRDNINDYIKHVPQPTMIGGGAKSNHERPLGYNNAYTYPSTLATGNVAKAHPLYQHESDSEDDQELVGGGFWKDFGKGVEKGFMGSMKVVGAPVAAAATMAETGDPKKGLDAFKTIKDVAGGAVDLSPQLKKVQKIAKKLKAKAPAVKHMKNEIVNLKKKNKKLDNQVKKAENNIEKMENVVEAAQFKLDRKLQEAHRKSEVLLKNAKQEDKHALKVADDYVKDAMKIEQAVVEELKKQRAPKAARKKRTKVPKGTQKAEVDNLVDSDDEGTPRVELKRLRRAKKVDGGAIPTGRKPRDIPEPTTPYTSRLLKGGARTNKRAEVVRQVMKEKGMKMIEASKYVKEHGLYKK